MYLCLKNLKSHGFGFNFVIFLSYRPDMKIASLNHNSWLLNFSKTNTFPAFKLLSFTKLDQPDFSRYFVVLLFDKVRYSCQLVSLEIKILTLLSRFCCLWVLGCHT